MKNPFFFFIFIFISHLGVSQESNIKALVGGTLIDGYGGQPIQNSVIIIEGDKIIAVGNQDNTVVPKNAEIISTEGMSVLPGLWDMHVHTMLTGHSDYTYWDKTYPALWKDVESSSKRTCSLEQFESSVFDFPSTVFDECCLDWESPQYCHGIFCRYFDPS